MNYELSGILLQSIWRDAEFASSDRGLTRDWIGEARATRNRRSAINKLKNTCVFVGHSRAIHRKLYMTRHTLRRFVRFGHLPGFVNLSR